MKFSIFLFQTFLAIFGAQRPYMPYSEMSVLPEVWADDCDKQAKALSVILAVKEWRGTFFKFFSKFLRLALTAEVRCLETSQKKAQNRKFFLTLKFQSE